MGDAAPNVEESKTTAQRVRANNKGELVVNVELPAGYHLNPSAPQRYRVSVKGETKHLQLVSARTGSEQEVSLTSKDLKLPLRIPFQSLAAGNVELNVQTTLFYCREDNTGDVPDQNARLACAGGGYGAELRRQCRFKEALCNKVDYID